MFAIISVNNDRLLPLHVRKYAVYLKGWVLLFGKLNVVIMKRSHRIALLAFELALIVIFSLLPINLGAASLALTLLPVLVIALTQDFKTAVLGGLIMGVTSLIGAFTVGAAGLTAPLFRNPLVSVLPRMCVPAVAWAVNKGLVAVAQRLQERAVSKKKSINEVENADQFVQESAKAQTQVKPDIRIKKPVRVVIDGISSALGVCANTALVLGMIWLFYGGKTVGDSAITPEFMMGLVSLNFVIEVIVMTLLTPPIVYAIRKQQEKNA